jgi:hypothetical protein
MPETARSSKCKSRANSSDTTPANAGRLSGRSVSWREHSRVPDVSRATQPNGLFQDRWKAFRNPQLCADKRSAMV